MYPALLLTIVTEPPSLYTSRLSGKSVIETRRIITILLSAICSITTCVISPPPQQHFCFSYIFTILINHRRSAKLLDNRLTLTNKNIRMNNQTTKFAFSNVSRVSFAPRCSPMEGIFSAKQWNKGLIFGPKFGLGFSVSMWAVRVEQSLECIYHRHMSRIVQKQLLLSIK